jgi:hypothetical protein
MSVSSETSEIEEVENQNSEDSINSVQRGSSEVLSSDLPSEDQLSVPVMSGPEEVLAALKNHAEALKQREDSAARKKARDDFIETLRSISELPESVAKTQIQMQAIQMGEQANIFLSPTGMDSIEHLRGPKSKKKPSDLLTKLNARIDKYTGDPTSSYSWDAFLTQFKIAIANLNYDDDELRTILLMSIEGDALSFFQARDDEFLQMGWSELLEEFTKRFDAKPRAGILSLMGMTQKSDESVRGFMDRMRIAAKPLMPPPVPRKRLVPNSAGEYVEIDNPAYSMQERERKLTVNSNEKFMVQFFTAGLKREVLQRLQTTDFPNLEAAAAAAHQAEDFLTAMGQYKSHHLKVNAIKEPAPVNALQEMEQRARSRSGSRSRDQNQGKTTGQCYNCQEYGHFANDCKKPSSTRGRGGSTSRNSRNSGNHDLMAKLNNIVQRLENLEGTKSKSKKGKKRNGSKSPHRSQSRGRDRRKKSNQNSRNSSRSGGSIYGSNRSSRSNSKN